jgi:hypothetical protein
MLNKIVDLLFQAILLVIYFLILTPLGILLRAFGKDYLSRPFRGDSLTYWIVRK